MKQFIRKVAKKNRHIPIIERNDFLWNFLRKPHLKFMNMDGTGSTLKVSKYLTIRIPSGYLASDLENYETENVEKLILAEFRKSVTDVKSFLTDISCSFEILSIDHEEHWWCEQQHC